MPEVLERNFMSAQVHKKRKEILTNLCETIVYLDSIRGFRRIEPEVIKMCFQRMRSSEFTQLWKTIRHDVEKIAYTPMNIPGLPALMRLIAFLKLILPIVLGLMILSLAAHLHTPLPLPEIFSEWAVSVIMQLLASAIIALLVVIDYIIRRRIINYEKTHKNKFSRGRERIKKVIEKLIVKLAMELRHLGEDPNKYKMEVFYRYNGLKVIKESRGKIFKRKYPVYTVICDLETTTGAL